MIVKLYVAFDEYGTPWHTTIRTSLQDTLAAVLSEPCVRVQGVTEEYLQKYSGISIGSFDIEVSRPNEITWVWGHNFNKQTSTERVAKSGNVGGT